MFLSGEAQFSAALRIGGSPLLVHERDPRIFDQWGQLKTASRYDAGFLWDLAIHR